MNRMSDYIGATELAARVGVAREDITPPVGINARNWGAATHDCATGVHRPLTLTALVIAVGDVPPLILVTADLGWWKSREDELWIRTGITAATGVRSPHVLLCLTHTHAGPNLHRAERTRPGGELIAPYLDAVRSSAAGAATRALATLVPARLGWRYGRCSLARNRDAPSDTDGRYLVGLNPSLPADDTLLVGRVMREGDSRLIATLVNYACHPTTLAWKNSLLSPDFPGAMRAHVESATGAPCLFLQGASGDLAPAEQYTGDTAVADRHGHRLACAVLGTLDAWPDACLRPGGVVESGAPLLEWKQDGAGVSEAIAVREIAVEFTVKNLPSEQEIQVLWTASTEGAARERLWRKLATRRTIGEGATVSIPLWVWRLGETLLFAQPNEAYSIWQTELRRHFAPRPCAVVNTANGYVGYLPPRDHYKRDQYSVWQTPFAEGSLETLISESIRAGDSILRNHLTS